MKDESTAVEAPLTDKERKDQSCVKQILVPESMYYDTALGHAVQSEDGAKDLPKKLKKKLEFSKDDDSKSELSSSLRGVARIEARASLIETLLQKLVVNKTGAEPYRLTDVTEGLMYTNLPDDIVEITPMVEPRQSEQGSIDKDGGWIGAATNTAMDVVDAGWGALVAGANFFKDMAEKAAEYGMKMLGAIADAVGQIVGAILDAFGALVDWVLGKLKQAVKTLLNPIYEAYESWANNIKDALGELLNEDNESLMTFSSETISFESFFELVFSGNFFQIITSVTYGLMAAYYSLVTIAKGLSLGMDTLMGVITGVIIGSMFTVGSLAIGQIFEGGAEKILEYASPKLVNDEFFKEGVGLTLFSLFVSSVSFLGTYMLKGGFSVKSDVIPFSFSILSLFLGMFSTQLQNKPLKNLAISGLSSIIAIFSTVFTISTHDALDSTYAPWSYIEEALAIGILGYNSENLGDALDNVLSG